MVTAKIDDYQWAGDLARVYNGRETFSFASPNEYFVIKRVEEIVFGATRLHSEIKNAGFWANWNKDRGYREGLWRHNPALR